MSFTQILPVSEFRNNAILSLFNITAEVKGELNGQIKQGMVYFSLKSREKKQAIHSNLLTLAKRPDLLSFKNIFEFSREKMKSNPAKAILKNTIEAIMHIELPMNRDLKKAIRKGHQ